MTRFVPIASLIRDPALQMRVTPHDPEHEAQLRDYIGGGGKPPPCEAVSDGRQFWLTDGWLRVAIYESMDRGQVECEVYSGGYADAKFRALSANSRHGQSRSREDMRQAVTSLLDSPDLLAKAKALAVGNGGLSVAIGRACGVSEGLVRKILAERGQHVKAGVIAPLPKDIQAAARVSVHTVPGTEAGMTANERPGNPPNVMDDEDDEISEPTPLAPPEPEPTPEESAAWSLRRAGLFVDQLGQEVVALLAGPVGDKLRACATKYGAGFGRNTEWKPLRTVREILEAVAKE